MLSFHLKKMVTLVLCSLFGSSVLLSRIHLWKCRPWRVSFVYTGRVNNCCANWMAKHSLSATGYDTVPMIVPDEELSSYVVRDGLGASIPPLR